MGIKYDVVGTELKNMVVENHVFSEISNTCVNWCAQQHFNFYQYWIYSAFLLPIILFIAIWAMNNISIIRNKVPEKYFYAINEHVFLFAIVLFLGLIVYLLVVGDANSLQNVIQYRGYA